MKIILIYLGWILLIPVLSGILSLIFFPLISVTRKIKFIAYAYPLISSIVSVAFTVFILVQITYFFDSKPTYLMFLLSWIGIYLNDIERIKVAKKGHTRVAQIVGEEYNRAMQIKFEYLYLFGDMIGLWAPVFFLGELPFI